MCGICGIYNFDKEPVNSELLEKMNDSMALRGPDDKGIFIDKDFGMAMRRLSIIDIEGGHQPISNEDQSIYTILNGEIYNYIELRRDLESQGHKFSTDSDTEVIVHLYEEYGTSAVNKLNGMFAFALWDKARRRLWIARDRVGIKPLLYYEHSKGIIFASTLDALANHTSFEKEINIDSMLQYFVLAYVPTPMSIWKNAKKLYPGHYILVENGKVKIEKYWHLEPQFILNENKENYTNNIKDIFANSIELHSRSDVPVGTFLSGGLDSSAVTALFCKHTNKPVHTFSIDFEGKEDNEGHYARLVAEKYQTIHHPITLDIDKALLELDELLLHMDEPMADSAIIPSYLLSKYARGEDITVVLCGSGGDEVFGGYNRHFRNRRDLISGRSKTIPLSFWQSINSILGHKIMHYGSLSWDKGATYGISTSGINLGIFNYMLNDSSLFFKSMSLTKEKFINLKTSEDLYGIGYGRMLTDIQNYLLDNVLALTDKTSMAASVEARVPLLDHRLIEASFSIPPEINLSNEYEKSKKTLKNSVQEILPHEILNRAKTGFNAPVNYWITRGHPSIEDSIKNINHPLLLEIFNKDKIESIWNDKNKRLLASESLFMIYIMNKWLELHA